ncbi:S41 family peptidase [Foetidibacter luteolus]|uniref:S41 family peptidase n=1 Tax=Foetidibacter luteolus TaxID=2608880 RepID=UPI00129B508C|nr:S41 family peptidase [Foetidibacter luteolus]
MRRTFFCLLLLAGITVTAQTNATYFLSQPALTPDGQTVIFSFEGDLWKAAVADGIATRITAMQGYETNAKVSPDGKWIAFTGRQYGNADVFIMPVNGGEIKQLTYYGGTDDVTSWSWDSKYIYFNSGRMGQSSTYKVSLQGETAQRVFGDYFFLYDHNVVEHPKTGELFFNDTWESSNQAQRKRYKGAFNPDIQSYNIAAKQYKRYTDWQGKDFGASIDKNGNIYFMSDEANGEYNLYTFKADKKTQLTKFTSSIKNPFVNADGGKVVFEKDYQLWLYDVAAGKADKLNIAIARNSVLDKEKDFDVKENISAFDVSPDGKKLAFSSRGELFVSDIEGKFIEQLQRGNAERVKEVKWLSDNKTLLFSATTQGYENWFTINANGSGNMKQVTFDKKSNRSIVFNSKRTQGVYYSGRDEVRMIDLKTLQSKTLVKDELWGLYNAAPSFSPNDEYIMFTAYRNFEQDIILFNTKTNKTLNLTNTAITETSPLWGPDGKYIYFMSSRLKPSYPTGMQEPRIYRVALQKFDEPYRIDKFNELFKEEKKDTAKDDSAKKKDENKKKDSDAKKDTAAAPLVIDAEKIMERLEHIGPSFGSQNLIAVVQKDDKTTVLYESDHAEGRGALYKTVLEPFEETKTEKITGTEGGDFVENDGKYFILSNGAVKKLNLDGNKADAINISYTFRRNLSGEFGQMFYEAWAQLEENYYDEKFHGIDWNKTRAYYEQFLPYLNNRNDLRVVLNDMLGELNSSHQGFYSYGSDENISLTSSTMETGIIFDNANPYKVKYVVAQSPADNKDVTIQPGDVLVKVGNTTVNPQKDRYVYFTRPSLDKELLLTFKRGEKEIVVKVHPQYSLYGNLYDEWIEKNRKTISEKSNNRIAYGYMKNMGQGELETFLVDMTKQLTHTDALILDLRYNTGGNVHDEVLRFLSQRSYLQWKYREGQLTKQSNFAPADKPIILLINEQSLSDAEMTAQGFKALKLGKIVGNETYRWIIFTTGAGLVDGSFVRIPAWGCYSLDGKDLEITGVSPDIKVVNTFEDKLNGRDPQLDTAISEIMKQLK